ncbi:pyruvate formate lyase family protein, partial [Paenibacillus polymyxa]|uniref:pyruvate formate lyase family protein n=1 Tax=Paenibacillus polymyxa TaxID=1406 RepID=UPI0006C71314
MKTWRRLFGTLGRRGFKKGKWTKEVNVNDFIETNILPYVGNEEFLVGPTANTTALWDIVSDLTKKELANGGVLDVDVNTPSTIISHKPGYLDRDKEQIVGVQTDAPFKRSLQPFGGIRMMIDACKAYGFEVPES